jgi:hypothetical protein
VDESEEESPFVYHKQKAPLNFNLIDNYQPKTDDNIFRVSINKWQKSRDGNYIEYIIEIEYLEGNGSKWQVRKRYTEFVELHDAF